MDNSAIVAVTYTSSWEEGDVESAAKLNLKTGEVFDIETSDEGAELEALIREYVDVRGCNTQAEVELMPDDTYRVVSKDRLDELRTHFGFTFDVPASSKTLVVSDADLAKEERKGRDMDVLSQRYGEQGKTDAESLPSLPGAEVRLNTGTGMIEITHADGAMAYLGDQTAVEQFSKDVGLSAPDRDRLLSLNTLGKQLSVSNVTLDDFPLVVTGRFVGPVVATKDGVAIQDTGRGVMVGHDMSKFDTPPKAGDKLDARYKNGLVRAVDELSKDNHSVSVSMHTR